MVKPSLDQGRQPYRLQANLQRILCISYHTRGQKYQERLVRDLVALVPTNLTIQRHKTTRGRRIFVRVFTENEYAWFDVGGFRGRSSLQ